jgi:hypothetical protein
MKKEELKEDTYEKPTPTKMKKLTDIVASFSPGSQPTPPPT